MNFVVLLLGLVAGALWLPVQVALTAQVVNSEHGCQVKPNLKLYGILGALMGLMAALGVIQAQVGMFGMLVAPGLVVGLVLVELLAIAAVALVIIVLQAICELVCSLLRWFIV